MKAYGAAGGAVTARVGLDVPTTPHRRPAHWPARPDRTAWPSPILASSDPSATPAAERAAARSADLPAGRVGGSRSAPSAAIPSPPVGGAGTGTAARGRRTGLPPAAAAGSSRRAVAASRGELLAQVRELWDAGMPQKQIAVEAGISVTGVQRLRRGAGLARRRKVLDGQEIVRLYVDERLSLEVIAARIGTSAGAVRYRLDAAGVSRRAPGRARALPNELRLEALARLASGERPVDVRRALGISETTLLRWRRAAAAADGLDARGGAR